MIAPSYISVLVLILSQVLPKIGVTIGSDALTTTIQTIIAIGVGLFVMYRQWATGRATLAGTRPQGFQQ
jgi:hypothetical protein